MNQKREIKEKLTERQRKYLISGILCSGIGGGIGAYFYAITGNYIYAGIGAFLGLLAGYLIALLFKKIDVKSLINFQNKLSVIFAVLSFFLAIAGVLGFFLTGQWITIVGSIFFTLCGFFFLKK